MMTRRQSGAAPTVPPAPHPRKRAAPATRAPLKPKRLKSAARATVPNTEGRPPASDHPSQLVTVPIAGNDASPAPMDNAAIVSEAVLGGRQAAGSNATPAAAVQRSVAVVIQDITGVENPQERNAPGRNYEEDDVAGQMTSESIFPALQQITLGTRGVINKTELSQNLKAIASRKGFNIADNQGEGNCMFFAISEQLDLIKRIKISHEELRQTVVQYLRDNPRQPDGTHLFHFVDGYSSWDAYLTSMKKDGTWGDHVILHGAANCFQVCIHVISSLLHHRDVMICPEYDVNGGNRLVLGHVHELHYVSLVSHEGCRGVSLPLSSC